MGLKFRNQEEIIEIVRDYVKSGDPIKVVARRHDVNPGTLSGWLKRTGLKTRRNKVNWEAVKENALR